MPTVSQTVFDFATSMTKIADEKDRLGKQLEIAAGEVRALTDENDRLIEQVGQTLDALVETTNLLRDVEENRDSWKYAAELWEDTYYMARNRADLAERIETENAEKAEALAKLAEILDVSPYQPVGSMVRDAVYALDNLKRSRIVVDEDGDVWKLCETCSDPKGAGPFYRMLRRGTTEASNVPCMSIDDLIAYGIAFR